MYHYLFVLLLAVSVSATAQYQYQKENVTIVRDSFGVPHIYGKTDADAAYGLAWAQCEDAFEWVQYNLLAAQKRLGEVKGIDGALFDFGVQFFGVDSLVAQRYQQDLSPEYRKVAEAFVQGVNDYAANHPDEVLLKGSFPATVQHLVTGYVAVGILMAGAGLDLQAINDNMMDKVFAPNEKGSNAMAIAPHRTEDGKAWLLINSHQPIEGEFAWYEAHINSDEGWNMIGGLFPGGTSAFVGCNQYLGWAHTNNYHNFGEIHQLKISPNKKSYFCDGEWRRFSYKVAKLKVKLGFLKIAVRRRIPICEFGPVFKKKHGWYALRYPSMFDIRSCEQWFRMNKARNFEEFETALKMQALPLFNVIYADVEGNIFLVSEGKIPLRDSTLNWSRPVDGTSSKYKWTTLLPYEQKVRYFNPDCGFVFNCNGTPLRATCYDENSRQSFVGLQLFDYNRNERFGRLLNEYDGKRFLWADFLRIKFDKAYDPNGSYARNFRVMFHLNPQQYPKIKEAISRLKQWDMTGDKDDRIASLAMLTNEFLSKETNMPYAFLMIQKDTITQSAMVKAIAKAQRYLLRHFGTLDVPLGMVQRLARGDKSLPIGGLSEVPRAVDTKYDKKRKCHVMTSGDGYMIMAKFGKQGVELHSVSAYGASAHPDSPHYTDQMDLFANEKTKIMSFDKETVFKNAKRIYQPR